jgi:hypothetical protein
MQHVRRRFDELPLIGEEARRIYVWHDSRITLGRPARTEPMALPIDTHVSRAHDSRALKILAKSLYRDLRASGYEEREVIALAGELLGLVSHEVRGRREPQGLPAQGTAKSPPSSTPD